MNWFMKNVPRVRIFQMSIRFLGCCGRKGQLKSFMIQKFFAQSLLQIRQTEQSYDFSLNIQLFVFDYRNHNKNGEDACLKNNFTRRV